MKKVLLSLTLLIAFSLFRVGEGSAEMKKVDTDGDGIPDTYVIIGEKKLEPKKPESKKPKPKKLKIPSISPPTRFIATADLASFTLDEEDNLYLLRDMEKEIVKYDSQGRIIEKIKLDTPRDPEFYRDSALLRDREGNFYINNEKFDSKGKRIAQFHFSGSEVFDQKFDEKGNRYVVRFTNKIMKFDSQGNEIFTMGQKGLKPGSFNFPSGIVMDEKGNMYIAELWNNRVQKFSPEGKFLFAFGRAGSGEGEFKNPYGIAIDSKDFIYVADTNNGRIQVFNSEGSYLLQIPLTRGCRSIGVDRKDNIYYSAGDIIYRIPSIEKQLRAAKPKKIHWVSTPTLPKERAVTPVTLEARIISRSPQTEIENITSPNRVNQILSDPIDKNYVWFATEGGLLRYNRNKKRWTTYTTAQGLLDNEVFSLTRDKDTLWIGSFEGISKYNLQTEEWINIELKNEDPICEFTDVKKDRFHPDDIWFTNRRGIIKYNKKTRKFLYYKPIIVTALSTHLRSIEFDPFKSELVWFVGSEKIVTYNHSKDSWKTQFTIDDLTQHRKRHRINIHSITVFKIDSYNPDLIWIGTVYNGLFQYNRKTKEWKNLPIGNAFFGTHVNSFTFGVNAIWIGTEDGLYRLDRETDELNQISTFANLKIGPIIQDRYNSDLNWLAINPTWKENTYLGGGIYCFDKKQDKAELVFTWSKLSSNHVHDIALIDDDMWLGTLPGITKYSKKTNSWHTYWGDSNVEVIEQDPVEKRYIWFGTGSGVRRLDIVTDNWDYFTKKDGLPHSWVTSIAFSRKEVWFGTLNGLSRYDRKTQQWRSYTTKEGLPMRRVGCLAVDESNPNYLWVGFKQGGVYRFNKKTEKWQSYPQITALGIYDIQIENGKVWYAANNGLAYYDLKNEEITQVDKRRTYAFLLSPDKKYVWVGQAPKGGRLLRYNRKTGDRIIYNCKKGLAGWQVNCLTYDKKDNCIWVGTTGGVSKIPFKD